MTFEEKNMATTDAVHTKWPSSPSRPAKGTLKPKHGLPDAPISTANSNVETHILPQSKRPANMPMETDVPEQDAPIPINGGDETMHLTQTKAATSRRKNPAKAGGIDQGAVATQQTPVDVNSTGESRGNGAHSSGGARPHTSPIAENSGEPGRDEASSTANTNRLQPRHEPISDGLAPAGTQYRNAVAGDQGAHRGVDTHSSNSPLIAEITQLVRMRRRWHKAEKSLTLQGKALCRSWTAGDKGAANAAYDRAAFGNPDDPILAMALAPFLDAKARFEGEREAIEKTLKKLAITLPVWKSWALGVKGLGALRLAVIVGECGDIGSYRNPSCLWKRMGLAVIGDQRQRRVTDASDALEHGYNPERRAIAYVMGTELLKAQVRNVKDEDGKRTDASNAIAPYGQLYLDRKVYEAGREGITKAHANNRAARYMVKRVLRDLYAAWRAA